MKKPFRKKRYAMAFLAVILPLLNTSQAGEFDKNLPREKQIANLFSLKDPFNAKKLHTRIQTFSKDFKENKSQLVKVIHARKNEAKAISNHVLLAAYKKDPSFQYLLQRDDLRKEFGMIDLALCVYDYQLNQSKTAMNQLLARLATEDIGSDSTTIVMIAVMDEWDLTVRAYRKHFIYTDGAGGHCMAHFQEKRAALYPEKYKKMKEQIEAPIKWAQPLLSQKK